MKRIRLFVLIMSLVAVMAVGIGCGAPQENPTPEVPGGSTTVTLTVSETISLGVYDTVTIPVTYNGKETIEFSCSAPEVLSISNGRMTGKSVGTAKVTVKAGELTDECTVTVNPINLEKLEFDGSVIGTMYVGDTVKLDLTPLYNGITLDKPVYTFLSADDSIATVSQDGTITAKAIGYTMINASCSIGGRDAGCAVSVNVASIGSVQFDNDLVEIYVINDGEFKNNANLSATAYERGVANPDAKLVYEVADSSICTLKDGVVTAVKPGITDVTVSYVASDGNTVTDTVSVKVSKIIKEIADKTYDVSAEEAFTINASMLGANSVTVTGAKVLYDSGLATPIVTAGRNLYFDSVLIFGEQKLVVETNYVEYVLPVRIWTAFIDSVSEFEKLRAATNGHYRLDKDIDLTDTNWTYDEETGNIFSGLLEGNGKTIKGLKISGSNGLFDVIGGGAIIKNINFEQAEIIASANNAGVLAGETQAGDTIIENVSVSVKVQGAFNGGLIGHVGGKLSAKGLTVYAYSNEDKEAVGALFGRVTGSVTTEEVKIYSSLAVSGVKADDVNENSQGGSVNISMQESVVAPNKIANGVEMFKFIEGYSVDVTVNGEAIVAGNDFRGINITNKKVIINKTDANKLAHKQVEIIVGFGGEEICYVAIDLLPVYHIYKTNIEDLKSVTDGEVYLKEDIDMSDVEWTAYPENNEECNKFTGVFDGEGHTISNFTTNSTSQKGSLFYIVDGGTIKNVAVVNATVLGSINGVFARGLQNGAKIENVYVHVKSLAYNASSLTGVIERTGTSLKDVTIVIDSASVSSYNNIISAQYGGNITVDNCYFYAPEKLPLYTGGAIGDEGGVMEGKYLRETDIISMVDRANSAENTMTNFVKGALLANQYLELNSSNIEKVKELTGGYVVLTEDIDMSEIEWTIHETDYRTHFFAGIFDGRGHTISNLTVAAGNHNGALFHNVKGGTVKNLAFTNVTGWSNDGVISSRATDATFENIFVQVATTRCANFGGIVAAAGGTNTFKNVFVQVDASSYMGTNAGMLTGTQCGTIIADNVVVMNTLGLDLDGADAVAILAADGETTATEGTDYFIYENFMDVKNAIKDGTIEMTELLTDTFNEINKPIEIGQSNITDLQTLTSGYVILVEDVDMSQVAWPVYAGTPKFSGTFDGQGYTISNFTTNATSQKGGLFYIVDGGTIKNLVLTNVMVKGSINGALGRGIQNGAVIENVFIHASKVENNAGTMFGVVEHSGADCTLKNVALIVDEFVKSSNNNLICGQYGGKIVLDNCIFSGPASVQTFSAGSLGAGYGTITGTLNEDYFRYTDVLDIITSNAQSELIKAAIDAVKAEKIESATVITKENIATLKTATSGYYVLGENIDMSDVTWEAHTGTPKFSGILNGQGYTISNFTTNSTSQKGGLFYIIDGGVIKNVSITNATVTGTINGVLGRGLQNGAVVENVYIHAASVASNSGAVAGVVESSGATLKDVTVVIDSMTKNSYNNVICGQYGGKITFENCYFSAPSNVDTFSAGSLGASGGIIVGVLDTDYFRFNEVSELLAVANGVNNTMTTFVKNAFIANKG